MVQDRRRWLTVAATIGAIVAPASADAGIQLGETFSPAGCPTDDVTLLQSSSPNGQYTVPFAGVITAWSYQADEMPTPLRLKVARPAGAPDTFMIVGQGDLKTPLPNQLNTYTDVQIAVQPGDVIGAYYADPNCGFITPGYSYHSLAGDQPPGIPKTYVPGSDAKFDIAATLEPDCDSDGLGDETQDPSLLGGSCPVRGRTLTLDANKNKVKKGKRVTLSGRVTEFARAGECQAGQTVQLERKKPSQATFTTIEQLQTDAAGNFSTKKKVKKTFEYRAQVAAGGGCGGQVSNTEKVKVKKEKK
jgi:hypothetical protein